MIDFMLKNFQKTSIAIIVVLLIAVAVSWVFGG